MTEYKDRFEKWQREARERFDEIDQQLGLKEKFGESAKAVIETAQKGAEKIRSEAGKSDVGKEAIRITEETLKTAGSTAKKAWTASEALRDVASEAGGKAGEAAKDLGKRASEIFEDARETVETGAGRVASIFNFGAAWGRTFESARRAVSKTSEWVYADPLRAATTGASMAVGAAAGAVFSGVSSHWLFNSALPAWSVKKLAEQFNGYLARREEMLAEGRLGDAEAERLRFERDVARRVGAPLLGAFSFASGAVLMSNVLNPKTITGAPIDWIIGGNPLLEGAWFFGNGLVCFKTSYDFFMIALDGQEDVRQIVREIKGMLPESIVS